MLNGLMDFHKSMRHERGTRITGLSSTRRIMEHDGAAVLMIGPQREAKPDFLEQLRVGDWLFYVLFCSVSKGIHSNILVTIRCYDDNGYGRFNPLDLLQNGYPGYVLQFVIKKHQVDIFLMIDVINRTVPLVADRMSYSTSKAKV